MGTALHEPGASDPGPGWQRLAGIRTGRYPGVNQDSRRLYETKRDHGLSRGDGPPRPCPTVAVDGGVPMPRSDDQTNQLIHQARRGSNEALGRWLDGCRGYLLRIAGDDL